jgi:hypothetical protein
MPAGSGRYPSGQRGQTVNLLAYAFGGSNPPLPTTDSGGNSSAVERQPSKLGVAGSNPVSRSIVSKARRAARTEGGLTEKLRAALADTPRGADVAPIGGLSGKRGAALADTPRGADVAPIGGLSGKRGAALADTPRGADVAPIGGLSGKRGAALADTPRTIGARHIDSGFAHVAQLAEHALGKGEVSGSIPDMGSRIFSPTHSAYGR